MSPAQYRKERTQRGLTQAALAALLGVPREAVVRREAGTQPIIDEAAMAILSLPKTKPAKPGKPNKENSSLLATLAEAPYKGVGCRDLLGRVLVACEYSGAVRDAFAARGWDAWSCDLLPSEKPGNHYQGDVRDMIGQGWDILIAHPPCTHLAVSGARWWASKPPSLQAAALDFVRLLLAAPVHHIALENPVSAISSRVRKPDQVIQPWQFGHGEVKATCLWLKNLPKLKPTCIVDGREARVHKMPPGPDRWKERSRTLPGIALAFADQWTRATRPNKADMPSGPR